MRMITRVAIGATITACVLVGTGHLASATSMDQASAAIENLNTEVTHASRMNTVASMKNACADIANAADEVLALRRPKVMPRSAWTHTIKATRYVALSAESCLDGDFRTAAGYSDQATDEWDAASAALSRYTG